MNIHSMIARGTSTAATAPRKNRLHSLPRRATAAHCPNSRSITSSVAAPSSKNPEKRIPRGRIKTNTNPSSAAAAASQGTIRRNLRPR